MVSFKRYIVLFFLVSLTINLQAQNLTGTWEGRLNKNSFLQLNIVQNGERICGYSWHYLLKDTQSSCKIYFEGCYSRTVKKWGIHAVSFIDKSDSSHGLISFEFNHKVHDKMEILVYRPGAGALILQLLGEERMTSLYLKKVSDKPVEIIDKMKECLPPDKALKDLPVAVNAPQKLKDTLNIDRELKQRKNIEQSRIEVNVKTINLKIYDNAVIDGDLVSILYNGKLLLSHQLLSEKAIELNIELDENQTRHEIILFAENLGSIPPNTALVVVTAGEKRYELFASASLEENAILVFDYKPKL
ncbi:MAG: hypothetical protein ABI685_00790 [Ferruginibacter sp.]